MGGATVTSKPSTPSSFNEDEDLDLALHSSEEDVDDDDEFRLDRRHPLAAMSDESDYDAAPTDSDGEHLPGKGKGKAKARSGAASTKAKKAKRTEAGGVGKLSAIPRLRSFSPDDTAPAAFTDASDFSSLTLKPDHASRPLYISPTPDPLSSKPSTPSLLKLPTSS